ncbi:unnamed protein product [Cylicocyclus nassatus]|uniref:Uncharacterized protein n=1 Tax=Cylicocyclus nassatus TaxID=53992 RepID=A0AA36GFK8_CYLNA|nr:unnamed protein product [Cylicocyclus nassatus]
MLRTLRRLATNHCRTATTSTKTEVVNAPYAELNSELFDEVQSRVNQHGNTIDKIIISFIDRDGSKKDYLMNRNISTPYDCARHVNMLLAKRAVLALTSYGGSTPQLGCMNESFRDRCNLEFIDFQSEIYATELNKAYWRSCSIILAAVLTEGLKNKISISDYHNEVSDSFFGVDVSGLTKSLTQSDLRDLSSFARSDFISRGIPFETVSLSSEVARDYGLGSSSLLCRFGNFVAPISGPVISRSDQVGRFAIVKARLKGNTTLVGGVSIPEAQKTSSFLWEKIMENASDKIGENGGS